METEGNLILSAAAGYQPQQLEPFLLSALQNTQADVGLIVQESDQALIRWLQGRRRLHLYVVKPEENPRHLAVSRFFHTLHLLKNNTATRVLLTDSRDVFFQADPFPALPAADEAGNSPVLLAAEPRLIQNCPINRSWLQQFFGQEQLQRILNKPVLCVGTILGARIGLQALLAQLCALMQQVIQAQGGMAWGLDQAALNVLVHASEHTAAHRICSNNTGPFTTLYHQPAISLDRFGRILCDHRIPAAVVHQYDRYPWLTTHLMSTLLKPSQQP